VHTGVDLSKILVWVTKILGGQWVATTDEIIGVSQLLGGCPQSLCLSQCTHYNQELLICFFKILYAKTLDAINVSFLSVANACVRLHLCQLNGGNKKSECSNDWIIQSFIYTI